MNKTQLSNLILLFFCSILNSQDLDLSILTIPDSMRADANSVIRYEETSIEIQSQTKMVLNFRTAITVLNKYGDDDGLIYLNYDDHDKIKHVSASILGPMGNVIKKIKRGDFEDISAVDNASLYSDNRALYYEYEPVSYPYTIVYEFESSSSNTAFIPTWYPIYRFHKSAILSKYSIQYPESIKIKTKEFNLTGFTVQNDSQEGHISYTIQNVQAYDYEPLSPILIKFIPHVKFAANKFSLAGEAGEANNWKEFGNWMNERLLSGKDDLSEATKAEVKQLVKNVEDPIERAEIVYDFMQDRTRYISVQIGIGGWKPMNASEVERLKYGDCKALTNYTKALLKAADVPSYYTILYADEKRNIDRDLASIQGNHAILMVPSKKDTVWLECTNQKAPFGYIGSFTDDREVLIVTEDGGKIVRTKKYLDRENTQFISGDLSILNDGKITASLHIVSEGKQYDDHYGIASMNEVKREAYYKSFFDEINNVNIEKIGVDNQIEAATFIEDIDFSAENYSVNSGDKMLVRLNIVNTSQSVPKRVRNRKLPLEIKYGFLDTDNVTIHLPSNYAVEAMAEPQILESKFGTYQIEIQKIDDTKLLYKRTLLIKEGTYSVADYNAYRKFRKKINQLDNSKIVLSKT